MKLKTKDRKAIQHFHNMDGISLTEAEKKSYLNKGIGYRNKYVFQIAEEYYRITYLPDKYSDWGGSGEVTIYRHLDANNDSFVDSFRFQP